MNASNHDIVGVLSHEMKVIFSPLIQNVNRTNQENTQSYQQMSVQMVRITNFFGALQAPVQRRKNQVEIQEEEPTINRFNHPDKRLVKGTWGQG